MEWITKAVETAVQALLSVMAADLGQFVLNLLSRLFVAPVGLLIDLELLDMVQYSRQIAWLLLPIILLRQGIQIAANRAEGMPSDSVESFSRRAVLACLAVGGTTALVSYGMRFADSIIQTFLGAQTGISSLSVLLVVPVGGGFASIVLALGLVMAFLVLLINRAVLNAQLAANMFLGPLAACSIAWGESALWNTWLRETFSVLLTFVFQTAMLWWLLAKIGSLSSGSFDSQLLVIGIVVLMVKGNDIIRRYTYAAGGGATLIAGAVTGTRYAVTWAMMRSIPASLLRGAGGAGGGTGS